MAVNALLVIRSGLQSAQGSVIVMGALLGLLAAGLFAASAWRGQVLRGERVHSPPALLMLTTTLAVLLGSAAGIWAIANQE